MSNPPPTSRTHWPAIFALFAAGLVAAMQFAKLVPVMSPLQSELGLSLVMAGLAVSLLGIIGVLFAIVISAVANAVGLQRGIAVALFGGALAAALGALAPTGSLLLATRLAEGFAHLLIVICAPALMAACAQPKDRPLALSLWACFFGAGFAIISTAAPYITPHFGWRGVLWAHAIAMLVVGLAVTTSLRKAALPENTTHSLPGLRYIANAHIALARSGTPLLLALTFCAYTILFLTMLTFLTRYLGEVQAWSPTRVGRFMALVSLVALVSTLATGVMVKRGLGFRVGMGLAFAMVAIASAGIFLAQPGDEMVMALATLMMIGFGLLPGFVMANVPRVAPTAEMAALTYGAIALFGNVGTFSGTPLFALAYEYGGWSAGAAFMVASCLAGSLLASIVHDRMARESHPA